MALLLFIGASTDHQSPLHYQELPLQAKMKLFTTVLFALGLLASSAAAARTCYCDTRVDPGCVNEDHMCKGYCAGATGKSCSKSYVSLLVGKHVG